MATTTTARIRQRLRRISPYQSLAWLAIFVCGIAIGWTGKTSQTTNATIAPVDAGLTRASLRLSGYNLVSPLLVCDTTITTNAPELNRLESRFTEVIAKAKQQKAITQGSVYFRDLQSGRQLAINGNETFFPASLKKVPLMMQFYKNSPAKPLTDTIAVTDKADYNQGTTIIPRFTAKHGTSYTRQQLIDYMIRYSDNNSFAALFTELGSAKFDEIYRQMQLNYPDTVVAIDDYITPYQFSLFFRTLYNATYLTPEKSEEALTLLTQTDYDKGLVTGVPSDVTVAHKFGISAVPQESGPTVGELHDCGIIYHDKHPYLLCVMTKSLSPEVDAVEKFIAEISQTAYTEVANDYRQN